MNIMKKPSVFSGKIINICTFSLILILLSACSPDPVPMELTTFTSIPSPLSPTATVIPPTEEPIESPRVLIPAGEFLMGSESGREDEKPVHKVYLDAFYIDNFQVTNAQYAVCITAGACTPLHNTTSQTRIKYFGEPEFANYPVIYVLWQQAREYCQWLGGDLPTEAQWEKAARGGLEGKLFFWGDTFEGTEANICDISCTQVGKDRNYNDGFPDTAPVGSFEPNGYGLYDMAGNTWDWVLDWYSESYYEISPYENPTGPETGVDNVARGGSWWFSVSAQKVARREIGKFNTNYSDAGFRCVFLP